MDKCWCGNLSLSKYNDTYLVCAECGTLISKQDKISAPNNCDSIDSNPVYNQDYWLKYMFSQYEAMGYNSIDEILLLHYRERVSYWATIFLKYLLPPATVAEIGCGIGTFVCLLQSLGFDASGYELSRSWCSFLKDKLDIKIYAEKFENTFDSDKLYDAIVLIDVLEHLYDPLELIKRISTRLKPNGFLLIQTPNFDPSKNYISACNENLNFLRYLLPEEHIYLFSRESIKKLLGECGFTLFYNEQSIFPSDMFFIASRFERKTNTKGEIQGEMLSKPDKILPYANVYNGFKFHKLTNDINVLKESFRELKDTNDGLMLQNKSLHHTLNSLPHRTASMLQTKYNQIKKIFLRKN
jgi:2-polyprenyl-3-methyl-5-hydroxy-6-metoxy-1,4-benzoquinol methylase